MIESVGMMSDIYELEQIRRRISERYRSDPNIRINVSLRQPKLRLSNVPVKITGVYRHIFQVEEASPGQTKRHALQYTDVQSPRRQYEHKKHFSDKFVWWKLSFSRRIMMAQTRRWSICWQRIWRSCETSAA